MSTWKLTTRERVSFKFMKGKENGRTKRQSRVFIICIEHMPNVYGSTYRVNMPKMFYLRAKWEKLAKRERIES